MYDPVSDILFHMAIHLFSGSENLILKSTAFAKVNSIKIIYFSL